MYMIYYVPTHTPLRITELGGEKFSVLYSYEGDVWEPTRFESEGAAEKMLERLREDNQLYRNSMVVTEEWINGTKRTSVI